MPPPLSASNFGQKCSRSRGMRSGEAVAWMDSGDRIFRNVAGLGSAGTTPCNADLFLAMSHVPPS